MAKVKGRLFIISAPSGGGKTTLCNMLLRKYNTISYSVSYTTREPRGMEKNGVEYYFISKAEFDAMIKNGEFIEYAYVHGNYYGTSRKRLEDNLAAGNDYLLDIDPQGATQMRQLFADAVFIFIKPPSLEVLRQRLNARNDTAEEILALRLANAEKELNYIAQYDYLIVNGDLDEAFKQLESVYIAEQCKTELLINQGE